MPIASTGVGRSCHPGGMCGRFVNFLKERETVEEFGIAEVAVDAHGLAPSWNVAPQQVAPIVTPVPDGPGRRLVAARWGLVPSWSKDARSGARMFNARSETAHSKPAFRSAFAERRCLVPANGYYEWEATADGKRPYYIHPADGSPADSRPSRSSRPRPRATSPESTTAAPSSSPETSGTPGWIRGRPWTRPGQSSARRPPTWSPTPCPRTWGGSGSTTRA